MITTLVAGFTLLVGFAGGLTLFKAKLKWCPHCGRSLKCPSCAPTEYHYTRL